jgi:hypothetical protein
MSGQGAAAGRTADHRFALCSRSILSMTTKATVATVATISRARFTFASLLTASAP